MLSSSCEAESSTDGSQIKCGTITETRKMRCGDWRRRKDDERAFSPHLEGFIKGRNDKRALKDFVSLKAHIQDLNFESS